MDNLDLFNDDAIEAAEIIAVAIMKAAKHLGNGDANTGEIPIGAIEGHGMVQKEGMESIAEALQAIAYALDNVATSINNLKETDDE